MHLVVPRSLFDGPPHVNKVEQSDRVVCLFSSLEMCSSKLRTASLTLFSAVILRFSAGCFSFLFYYFFIQTRCSELLSHDLIRALRLAETPS